MNDLHPVLEIKNLKVSFVAEGESMPAVKGINLVINRNEIVGIAGESGSGKSVTALSLMRLLPTSALFTSGEILFSDDGVHQTNILSLNKKELESLRGNKIGMIFQEPMSSLNPVFTCGDQVAEAIRLHQSATAEEAREKTLSLFSKVRLPDPAAVFDRYPHQLSGGQKQRVMIAMAMSANPALLICDEPTTALDATVQKAVLGLIRELQAETGMSVLFITHDLGVLSEIADRIIVMYRGEIRETGQTARIFSNPENDYTRALLACRPALYQKGARLPVVDDFLTNKAVRPAVSSLPVMDNGKRETLISVRNLTVKFPAKRSLFGTPSAYVTAVDDVSFDIFRGETLGLVGESGSGKTTVGRALLRLIEPSSGKLLYGGTNLSQLQGNKLRKFRTRMQIIFQDPYSSLNPSSTIGSLIGEPLAVHQKNLSTAGRRSKVLSLLEKVGLDAGHYNRYPHEFSGGQRQRIVIARALALQPEFIVCDESVSALDVSVQAQVLNLLNDLKAEFGFTSIFISHDLSVIRYVSDRVMVLHKGRIEEIGDTEQVCGHPRSAYTRKLLESVPGAAVDR